MYRSSTMGAAMLLLAATAGCAGGTSSPQPSPSAVPVHYAGLNGECPTLTSPESQRFTGSGQARLHAIPRQPATFTFINCGWGKAPVRPWVTVIITIYRNEPASSGHDRANGHLDRSRDDAVRQANEDPTRARRAIERTTPTGRALLSVDADQDRLAQHTVIGNAMLTVSLFETESATASVGARADELADGLAPTAEAITAEIASQLRPGPDPAPLVSPASSPGMLPV